MNVPRPRRPAWAVVAVAAAGGAGIGLLFWSIVTVLYTAGRGWIALAVLVAGTVVCTLALVHVIVRRGG